MNFLPLFAVAKYQNKQLQGQRMGIFLTHGSRIDSHHDNKK